MNCYIKSRNVYLRKNINGALETCKKKDADVFEYNKACNMLKSLPKFLQRFPFHTEIIVDEVNPAKAEVVAEIDGEEVHIKFDVPQSIAEWEAKLSQYNGLQDEVVKRKEDLLNMESIVDREISNILHEIELDEWKNVCAAYQYYKRLKVARERRRYIKDELLIVNEILRNDFGIINMQNLHKVISGLENRKYTPRDIGNYDEWRD